MPDNRVPMQNRYPYSKSLFMYLRGEEVMRMKEWLSDLNDIYNFTNKTLDLKSDYFGFDTVHFVRDFQKFVGLSPTGTYDLATHTAMEWKQSEFLSKYQDTPKAAAKPQPAWLNQRKW